MAECEGRSHSMDKQPSAGDNVGECSLSAYQHLQQYRTNNCGSGTTHSDETEANISETIPKIFNYSSSKFHCTVCNVQYNRRLDYVLHVRQNHTNNEKFKCDLCVKVCSSYPALMRHKIMAHTGARYTY